MAYLGYEPSKVAVTVGQGVIDATHIQDASITTADLGNDSVTPIKVDDDGTGFQMGSLGLGTAVSGSNKLTVGGTASFTDDVSLSVAGKRYYIPRASDGALTGSLYSSTGNTITLSGAGSSSGQIEFIPSAANSSAVAMTIDSSQRVGIGITSPASMLHLKGTDPIVRLQDSAGGDVFGAYVSDSTGFGIFNFTDSRQDLTIDGSGKVGIGITSPAYTLDLSSSDAIVSQFTGSSGETILSLDNTSTNGDKWYLISGGSGGSFSGGKFGIYNADTTTAVATFTNDGNVGIGTTSVNSNAKVHIRQASSGQTSSSNNTQLTVENSGSAGIQLLTGTSNVGGLWIGDSNGSETGGKLYYSNSTDTWSFYNSGGTNSLNISTTLSTFGTTVLIDGVSNYNGLEVKGLGGSRPQIQWSNANNGDLGVIYATEGQALIIGTGNSNTTALTLDSSQGATFAGNVLIGNTSGGSIYFTPQTGNVGGISWGGIYGGAFTKLVNIDNHNWQDVAQISFNNSSWGTVMFELKFCDEGSRAGVWIASTQGYDGITALESITTHGELANSNFGDNFQFAYVSQGNIKLQAKNWNSVGGMGVLVTIIGGNRSSNNDIGITWLR